MPDALFNEKVNHPVVFEVDALHQEDPDDDIWPPNRQLPSRGVVVFGNHVTEPVVTPNMWNEQTIHQSVRLCRDRGFVPGAIVAAKPLLGSGNDWKVKSFVYWGIITSLNTYIPGQVYNVYAPITVRWLQASNHNNRVEDKLFPADLYLIHAALTEETIIAKMQQQQQDYS